MDDLLKRLDTASCNGTVNLYARARDEITALRARLEAVEKRGKVLEQGWKIADDGRIDAEVRAERAEAVTKAARDLCDALVKNGFGKTSDRALPGEYDTLRALLDGKDNAGDPT